jgi:hypothetical protein
VTVKQPIHESKRLYLHWKAEGPALAAEERRRRQQRMIDAHLRGDSLRTIGDREEISYQRVHQILKEVNIDDIRMATWGTLSLRSVNILRRLGYLSLDAVQQSPPTKLAVLNVNSAGVRVLRELEAILGVRLP